jgi:hypothetical protein
VDELKKKILEISEIAKQVPENLQQSCFEILLKDLLATPSQPAPPREQPLRRETPTKDLDDKQKTSVDDAVKTQDDLVEGDLHVKVKHFLKKYGLTVGHLNNLFYKEADVVLPLYEDLATTRASEGQLRIALLQALRNAIFAGEFEFNVEAVRQECKDRKYYDSANFATNIKKTLDLFDIDDYTKDTKTAKLSEAGKRELSDIVEELQ